MPIGEKLRDLRIEKELTSNQLADELCKIYDLTITGSALGKYERNERQPDYATLTILADYYQVSLDWLFNRTSYKQLSDDIIKSINKDDYKLFNNTKLLIDYFIDIGFLESLDDLDEDFINRFLNFINSFVSLGDIFEQLKK